MKLYKNINIVIFLWGVIFLSSCSNFLDTNPVDKITPVNFWKTSEDATAGLNALYKWMPGVDEVVWDSMSDIGTINFDSDDESRVLRGEHTSDMPYFLNHYRNLYKAIHDVNYFIENVPLVREHDPMYSDEIMQNQIAQAKVIRAINYMRLVSLFGDVPLVTKTLTLSEGREVSREKADVVWDFIESELTVASENLKVSYKDDVTQIGRITKGAALGLKARAMLYAGRYEKAATAAKQVMDMNLYQLYPEFSKLFSYGAQNNCEVILDRQYEKALSMNSSFSTYAPKGMFGATKIAPNNTLVDIYETVDGNPEDKYNPYERKDPRLAATIWLSSFSDDVKGDVMYNGQILDARPGSGTTDEVNVDFQRSKTGFSLKKYINNEDFDDRSNCGTNFIILRYADILLMYAEAKIETNNIDASVYEAINLVRNGRDDVKMPSITEGKSQEQLRQIVRDERAKELALEGLRFFDIRRWRVAEELLQGAIPGLRYIKPGDDSKIGKINQFFYGGIFRAFNPKRDYLFPIPQQERALNPKLTQNPEY